MAVTVLDYMRRLKTAQNNIEKVIAIAIDQNQEAIIEVNKKNLDKGLNRDLRLVGTYSVGSELAYRGSGSPRLTRPLKPKIFGQPYNFYWTGRFYEGIFITYANNKITFHSNGKGDGEKLSFINSNKLLGVNNQEDIDYINFKIILPAVVQLIRNQ